MFSKSKVPRFSYVVTGQIPASKQETPKQKCQTVAKDVIPQQVVKSDERPFKKPNLRPSESRLEGTAPPRLSSRVSNACISSKIPSPISKKVGKRIVRPLEKPGIRLEIVSSLERQLSQMPLASLSLTQAILEKRQDILRYFHDMMATCHFAQEDKVSHKMRLFTEEGEQLKLKVKMNRDAFDSTIHDVIKNIYNVLGLTHRGTRTASDPAAHAGDLGGEMALKIDLEIKNSETQSKITAMGVKSKECESRIAQMMSQMYILEKQLREKESTNQEIIEESRRHMEESNRAAEKWRKHNESLRTKLKNMEATHQEYKLTAEMSIEGKEEERQKLEILVGLYEERRKEAEEKENERNKALAGGADNRLSIPEWKEAANPTSEESDMTPSTNQPSDDARETSSTSTSLNSLGCSSDPRIPIVTTESHSSLETEQIGRSQRSSRREEIHKQDVLPNDVGDSPSMPKMMGAPTIEPNSSKSTHESLIVEPSDGEHVDQEFVLSNSSEYLCEKDVADRPMGMNASGETPMQFKLSEMTRTLAELVRHNAELELVVTQKQFEMQHRDRMLQEQNKVMRVKDELINIYRSNEQQQCFVDLARNQL